MVLVGLDAHNISQKYNLSANLWNSGSKGKGKGIQCECDLLISHCCSTLHTSLVGTKLVLVNQTLLSIMKTILTTAIAFCIFLITSCGPKMVPFTGDMERETGLNKEQLKKVQFYNSGPIFLIREINNNTTEIIRGEIKMKDGKQLEQIVIPPNTRGVVINSNSERLGISFESGTDRYLVFGQNQHQSNAYTILAKDWKNNIGTVQYDGRDFRINTETANIHLMVNVKRLKSLKVHSRTAKGRSVGKH